MDILQLRVILISVSIFFFVDNHSVVASTDKYVPYAQIGGSKYFNNDASKYSADGNVFIPLWQTENKIIYSHFRHVDRIGEAFDCSINAGYRHLLLKNNILYGLYSSYEHKNYRSNNHFHWARIGAETWVDRFFIGTNYYISIGAKKKEVSFNRVEVQGSDNSKHYYNILETYESSFNGLDGELGYEVIDGLIIYAGSYYYRQACFNRTIYKGLKARISYNIFPSKDLWISNIFDKINIESSFEKDKERGRVGVLNINLATNLLSRKDIELDRMSRHMVDLISKGDFRIESKNTIVMSFEVKKKIAKKDKTSGIEIISIAKKISRPCVKKRPTLVYEKTISEPSWSLYWTVPMFDVGVKYEQKNKEITERRYKMYK